MTHDEVGPSVIDEDEFEEQGESVAPCQCGLSSNKPFCDGSQQACADEEAGTVYRYDSGGERHVADDD